MSFFEQSVMGGGGGGLGMLHYNFVVITPVIMKFGTGIKTDVFYTMVTKKFVTLLLYNVIMTYFTWSSELPNPFTDLAEILHSEVFWRACCKYQVGFYFWKL